MANGKLIGSAEFGVFEKRNNGTGEVEYEAISTVNKGLKINPSDEVRTIARKRIEVREVENQDLDGDTFYKKNVKTKQLEGDSDSGSNSHKGSYRDEPESNDKPSSLQVLKNFVDKINDRVTGHDNWLIALALILGATLIIALISLVLIL